MSGACIARARIRPSGVSRLAALVEINNSFASGVLTSAVCIAPSSVGSRSDHIHTSSPIINVGCSQPWARPPSDATMSRAVSKLEFDAATISSPSQTFRHSASYDGKTGPWSTDRIEGALAATLVDYGAV
jgi:hypothetical protein